MPVALPHGVNLRPLTTHSDDRGTFTEIFRDEWSVGLRPIQWNTVVSNAGVLRGVHVHLVHQDFLVLLSGRASIGLRDLRPNSATFGTASLIEMRGESLTGLSIPAGVAHGFYFHEPSVHLYCVDQYFSPSDELGCHWLDPALEIPWPVTEAVTSPRDAQAPPLAALLAKLGVPI